MKIKYLFFLLTIISVACKSQNINTGEKKNDPNAPQESYKTVMNEKFLSTINIPFDIAMSDVEKQINATTPSLIYEDNSLEDNNFDNFMCKVWKKGTITVTANPVDNSFNFVVPLKVWVKMGYKVLGLSIPPKESEFEFNLKFKTLFTILPNWTAQTQTTLTGYDWVTKPTLVFSGVSVPITPFVEKALDSRKDMLAKSIDDGVKKNIEVKKYVVQAWNSMLQPTLLSDKYRTWLKLTPIELQMTPLKTVNNRVAATIGLKAYTETVTGDKPVFQAVTSVPDLKVVPAVTENFQVGVLSEIPFSEAQKLTADTIVGQTFTFKDGKYKVEVTEIDIYGNEDQMVIKATLQGSMKGNIYFKGNPTFNPADTTVYLENFDYELKTKNLLLKMANWLFAGKLAKNMKEALTFKIAGQLAEVRKQVEGTLTNNKISKGVTLNGKLEDLMPSKVYLTSKGITAVTFAKGRMTLTVDGL
jgi:hypothetical protein